MKMSLDWHKQCLKNMIINMQEKEAYSIRVREDYLRAHRDVEFAKAQVAEAERRGLDGYDNDRLLVKRSPK